MNTFEKRKSWKFWLIFVAAPIMVIVCSLLVTYRIYVGKGIDIRRGLFYAELHRYNEAIEVFEMGLATNPEDANIHYYMGLSYFNLKEYDKAISKFNTALKIKPDFSDAHLQFAVIKMTKALELRKLGRDEPLVLEKLLEAEDICREIIERDPNYKHAHTCLGEIHIAQGLIEDAIIEYENALKIDKSLIYAHIALLRLCMQEGKIDLAKKQCNVFLSEIDPDNYQILTLLSTIYDQQSEYIKAIVCLKRILEKKPEDVTARTQLGILYLKISEYDEAFIEAEKVCKLSPSALPQAIYLIKGNVFLQRKEYEFAEKEFSKMLQLNDTYEGYFSMARLKFEQGNYDECYGYCESGLQIRPTDAHLHNIRGMVYINEGMLDYAMVEFNNIIDINPDFIPAYLNLADIKLNLNQFSIAALLYKTALKLNPDMVKAHVGLGNSYALMGNQEDAISEFETVEERYPENVNIYSSLAKGYMVLGKDYKAKEMVTKALSLEPKNQIANLLLAKIHVRNEDIPKAINIMKPILLDNPEFIDAYELGILYMDKGDYDNAILIYKQGIAHFPDNVLLWCNMAVVYLMQEGYKDAEDACLEALKIQIDGIIPNLCMVNILMTKGEFAEAKNHLIDMVKLSDLQKNRYQDFIEFCDRNSGLADKVTYHMCRAIAFTNNKWLKRALREYEEITKIAPSNTVAYSELTDIMLLTGENGKAIEICKKMLELEPESPYAYNKLAGIYNRNGRRDDAEALYRNVISFAPNNVTAHLNLGIILESKNLIKESIEEYKKVIELEPLSTMAYNNLAWLYVSRKQGKLDYALELSGKAKELAPENPVVIDTLGWTYYMNDMYDEAVSELETAVKSLPWNPTIRYHLGMAYYKKGLQELALKEMRRALRISNNFPEAKEARELIEKICRIKGAEKETNLIL